MIRYVLAAALVASPAAAASNWVFLANCGDTGAARVYSYDPGSLVREGAGVTVRLRGDYSQVPGSAAKEARLVWQIDCANKTLVERERVEFGADGKAIASYGEATGAQGITRGSVAEKASGRLCG